MAAGLASFATAGHGLRPSVPIAVPPAGASLPPERRGRLRNGAAPGDFLAAPRCGAHTRTGGCCQQPAMRNGRCRLHGGLSTGPRTAEGRARCAAARRKHGFYSAATRALLAEARARLRRVRSLAVRPTAGHGVLPSNSPMSTAPAGKISHRAHRGHRGSVMKSTPAPIARNHSSSVPSVSSVVNLSSTAGHGLLPSKSTGTPPSGRPAARLAPRPGLVRRTLLGSTALGLGLTVRPPVPAGHGVLPSISGGGSTDDGRQAPEGRLRATCRGRTLDGVVFCPPSSVV
jgi:hypothetical protein